LIDFFEKYRYQEVVSSRRQMPYFRSHPLSSDRISALRKRVEESLATAAPQTPEAIDQLARMKAKLEGFLNPYAQVYRKYPPTDTSIPARYARAIAAYRVPDIGAAMKEIDGLLELEPDNPYFHELKGQILFENGKAEASVAPHRRSVELLPRQPLLKVNLARSLTEVGGEANIAEAEGLLIDALALERGNGFAWDQLARVYAKQERIGDADLATAEAAYAIGDLRRAFVFARRAEKKLDPQTPNGRRASDISAITDPRAQRGRG
jgi:predicted Zn-dependent protease